MEEERQGVSLRMDVSDQYWAELERRVRRAVAAVRAGEADPAAGSAVDLTGLIDLRREMQQINERLGRLERRQILQAPEGEAEPSERLRYLEEQEPEIVELARAIGVDLSVDNTVRLLALDKLSMADAGRVLTPKERESPIHQSSVKDMIDRKGLPHVMVYNKRLSRDTPQVKPIELLRWKAGLPGDERFVNKDLAAGQPQQGGEKRNRRKVR